MYRHVLLLTVTAAVNHATVADAVCLIPKDAAGSPSLGAYSLDTHELCIHS